MWFPPFEALLHADPETALREASRSLERLKSFEGERFVNDSPMGAFYLTLGKTERAREWFEETTEPGNRRQVFLAAVAYVEEDHKATTKHLEQLLKARESRRRTQGSVREPNRRGRTASPPPGPTATLLLTRAGLLAEADFNPTTAPGHIRFYSGTDQKASWHTTRCARSEPRQQDRRAEDAWRGSFIH